MNRLKNKITVATLCLLILAGQSPFAFADEVSENPVTGGPAVTEQQDESSKDAAQGSTEKETPASGETGTETGDSESPVSIHKLSGKVLEYKYGADKSSAKGTNKKEIKIKVGGNVTKTIQPESDGSFSLELEDSEVIGSGEYSWSIDKDEDYLASSGTIKENEDAEVYVSERYEASASDYKMADSDNIINKILRMAGKYVVLPTGDNKLASSLDGDAKSSLTLSVDKDGKIEPFYIVKDGKCSKLFEPDKVTIDDGAPKIGTVTTEAAGKDTYVKAHGIYGKTKAEVLIKAEITEKGVGIKNVQLIGKNGDKETVYESNSKQVFKGEYTYTIPLPSEETLLENEVLYIVAEDFFGNKSEEKLVAKSKDGSTVTLEAIAPNLEISFDSKPNSNGWYKELPTVKATAKDDISGLESLSVSEDGDELNSLKLEEKATDEKSISAKLKVDSPSSDGSYDIEVKATDNSGNERTETRSVKIDLVAPVVSAEGVENGEHYKKAPSISIEEDEKYYNADGASITYTVKRDNGAAVTKRLDKVNKATIPSSMFSTDGEYEVTASAVDAAGNYSNEVSFSFIKDSTAPVVTWSGVQNGKFYNKKQTAVLTVNERFYSTNKVTTNATKKLGENTTGVGFPWSNTGVTSKSSKTFSETGTYTLSASATDKAGNSSGQKTVTFTIDTKAPEISISGVTDGGVYTYGEGVNPHYKVKDDYPATESVTYTKAGQVVKNPSFGQQKENDGVYTMTVTATDKAGNSSSKTVTFTINRFGSYFEYDSSVKNVMGKAFKNMNSDLVIREFNVSDLKKSNLKVTRDGSPVEAATKTSEENSSNGYKVYRHTFPSDAFEQEGAYEINVSSEDTAGNTMESKEENGKVVFYVDRTAPSLSAAGIDPKGIKGTEAKITISASDLLTGINSISATVNGEPVNLKDNEDGTYTLTLHEGMKQAIKVVATDAAGNEVTLEDTASVSSSAFSLFVNNYKLPLGIGLAALLGAGLWFIIGKRRKKDEEEEQEQ